MSNNNRQLEVKSSKSNKEGITGAYRSIPKLPKGSYKEDIKSFAKRIKKYSPEVKKRLFKKYKTINAATEQYRKMKASGKTPTSVLTDLQKMEIIELAGRYFTPSQIMDIIRNEWNIKYSNTALNALLRRNKDLIYDKRKKYASSVDGLRLVHERPRIEELTEIYEEARSNNNPKLALEALKEIRQEVKGDTLRIDGNMNMNVNVNVKQHLLHEIDVQSFVRLAFMKVLDKHDINFMKIAHRFKTMKIEVDPTTGEKVSKVMPINLEGVGLLPEAKVKKNLEAEEAKFVDDVEEVKNLLKEKIKSKSKELHKIKSDVDIREDIDKPEELEKLKRKTMKKRKKMAKEGFEKADEKDLQQRILKLKKRLLDKEKGKSR